MKPEFITVLCDVYCKCGDTPARYRAYVNDELFSERTWIWRDVYLEEMLQINAAPGKYTIRYELVDGYKQQRRHENSQYASGSRSGTYSW